MIASIAALGASVEGATPSSFAMAPHSPRSTFNLADVGGHGDDGFGHVWSPEGIGAIFRVFGAVGSGIRRKFIALRRAEWHDVATKPISKPSKDKGT